jgi:hypothetical protein
MVTEGRLRQKKLENQLKLEAKLHDLEVRPPTPMSEDLHDMNLSIIVPNYLSTIWHLFPLTLWRDVWILVLSVSESKVAELLDGVASREFLVL